MTETRDPTRWREGGASAPDGFAQLARDDEALGPSGEQLARVVDGVALKVARPELAGAYRAQLSASGAGASTSGALIAKLGGGALALVLGLGGAAFWLSRGEPDRGGVQPQSEAQKADAPGNAPPAATEPAAQHVPTQTPSVAAGEPQATAGAGPGTEPPDAPRSRAEEPRDRARPAAGGDGADDPAAELALLERAQRALRGNPDSALALAEAHRAQFPRGQFAQEREMLAIEALLDLDRVPAARRRAALFERRHPRSSHLPRLRDLLQRP
jgi:hypothetical protein